MTTIDKLTEVMRSDWNRRINHDYRFWMSDGYQDDRTMWESGERDLVKLLDGLSVRPEQSFIEIGCGVGRLLKAALARFAHVTGVDVSEKAIEKAQELLGRHPALNLIVGNGKDLVAVPTASQDIVTSFAAFSSIPALVIANYLREIRRVVKPAGHIRLQMYVGTGAPVQSSDTLYVRCFSMEHVRGALQKAGMEIVGVKELVLPIQVSFKELGIEAVIIDAVPSSAAVDSADAIAEALLPGGEPLESTDTLGRDLEYWMTLNYARELVDRGDIEKAREALHYAATVQKCAAIDIGDMLQQIVSKIEAHDRARSGNSPKTIATPWVASSSTFDQNLELLRSRFPDVAAVVLTAKSPPDIEVAQSAEGPVLRALGQALDHPTKPRSGGEEWANRMLREQRVQNCHEFLVVGIGGGYHLDSLVRLLGAKGDYQLSVVEPSLEQFVAALAARDQREWLRKIKYLAVGPSAALPRDANRAELWIRPQSQAVEPEACGKLRAEFYGTRGLGLLHPTIGVMGPLQGGTLPMLSYVTRALGVLNQRTREYDVSGFNEGYAQVEKFLREPHRRTAVETHFCEMVSQVVLESIQERPIDILICMALAPISPRVLAELRKRGVITVLWFVEDYSRFTYWQHVAQYFDFVFTIQKGKCIEALRAAGAGEVQYLPVACDPGVHAPLELSLEEKARWGSPISFMGAGYHNRQQLFASMADYPLKLWGTEWPTCRPFDRMVQEGGRRLAPAEYVKVFNATDININLHSSHERDGVDPFGDFLNPRTFELAASGVFQLVDKRSLLGDAFEIGKELVTFESGADLKEKVAYYMAHPEERAAVARAGRERALRDHTYAHRIKQMLSVVYSSRYEQLKAREDASPWKKMMVRSKRFPELEKRCEVAFARGEEPNLDALISDIVAGKGKLTETEQKLLFLFHVRKQIIRMKQEENGGAR